MKMFVNAGEAGRLEDSAKPLLDATADLCSRDITNCLHVFAGAPHVSGTFVELRQAVYFEVFEKPFLDATASCHPPSTN
jgi:hypothetical protein